MVTPLDLVKCRIQVNPEKYKSVFTGFRVSFTINHKLNHYSRNIGLIFELFHRQHLQKMEPRDWRGVGPQPSLVIPYKECSNSVSMKSSKYTTQDLLEKSCRTNTGLAFTSFRLPLQNSSQILVWLLSKPLRYNTSNPIPNYFGSSKKWFWSKTASTFLIPRPLYHVLCKLHQIPSFTPGKGALLIERVRLLLPGQNPNHAWIC